MMCYTVLSTAYTAYKHNLQPECKNVTCGNFGIPSQLTEEEREESLPTNPTVLFLNILHVEKNVSNKLV